jgi:hypothetical protein
VSQYHSWFDRLTTNGIVECKLKSLRVRSELVGGRTGNARQAPTEGLMLRVNEEVPLSLVSHRKGGGTMRTLGAYTAT